MRTQRWDIPALELNPGLTVTFDGETYKAGIFDETTSKIHPTSAFAWILPSGQARCARIMSFRTYEGFGRDLFRGSAAILRFCIETEDLQEGGVLTVPREGMARIERGDLWLLNTLGFSGLNGTKELIAQADHIYTATGDRFPELAQATTGQIPVQQNLTAVTTQLTA